MILHVCHLLNILVKLFFVVLLNSLFFGPKAYISFSSKYMMDALRVLNTENIILQINGDDKPIIINSVDDDTIVELILPIKTY